MCGDAVQAAKYFTFIFFGLSCFVILLFGGFVITHCFRRLRRRHEPNVPVSHQSLLHSLSDMRVTVKRLQFFLNMSSLMYPIEMLCFCYKAHHSRAGSFNGDIRCFRDLQRVLHGREGSALFLCQGVHQLILLCCCQGGADVWECG